LCVLDSKGYYDRGDLGDPLKDFKSRRGHELDLAMTRVGSSSCPLRDIIAEIRDDERESKERQRLQKEKMDRIRDRNRARNTLATWKEFVQVLPNYNLKDIGTRYLRMLY